MNRKSLPVLLAALAAASAATDASAVIINAPGSYQLAAGQGSDWTPATAVPWTETASGSNIFEFSLTALPLAASYGYKILATPDGGTPDWNPPSVQVTPADSWFTTNLSGDVTLRLDYNDTNAPKWGHTGIWTPRLVGTFQNEAGSASDWNPGDANFDMTSSGATTWAKSLQVSTPGTYEVKLTDGIANDWTNRQFGANGYRNDASTFVFTTTLADQTVDFSFDQLLGTFGVAGVVPTPPTWKNNASGAWTNPDNWLGNSGAPDGIDAEAVFGPVNDHPRFVFNDSGHAVTVGKMTFDSPSEYQLVGAWGLTTEVSTGVAQINVLQGTHKINLPLIVASPTEISTAAGTTLFISDPVTVNVGASLTEAAGSAGTVLYESTVTLGAGASLAASSSTHMAGLTVGESALATMNDTAGSKVLSADALSISPAGGKLDLKDNKLITKAATGYSGGDYTGVAKMVKDARNNGTWDGASGITTSMPLAASNATTLAVATAGELGIATFAGQAVAPGDTLVAYTFNGDANLSGGVDADDYFVIDSNYNDSGTKFGFAQGDFNYDGMINGDDYAAIDAGFSGQLAPGALAGGVTAVPEPASIGLLAVAAVAGLRRRRRA